VFDLHCQILPGIDDGARNVETSLEMARTFVAYGVSIVACTPHILPGLCHNTGRGIREAVAELQLVVQAAGIPLQLIAGADNHLTPSMVSEFRSGHLLSLGDTRYVRIGGRRFCSHPDASRAVDLDRKQLHHCGKTGPWWCFDATYCRLLAWSIR
jgi:tyrosine-protein phosphatase YwqE